MAKIPARPPDQGRHVLEDAGVHRAHRVQGQEVQSDGAEVDALHREILETRRPEGTPVAHAVSEDAPGEQRSAFVVPNRLQNLRIVMGLRLPHSEGDQARSLDPRGRALRPHGPGTIPPHNISSV